MIDVHSHVLPNIDDGSRSVEETANMLKEAHKNGFSGIICTPHYFEGYYEVQKNQVKAIIDALNRNIEKQWHNFKLYQGNEIFLTNHFAEQIKKDRSSPMVNSGYILFEFPINDKPINIVGLVNQITDYGFIPIFAHPERYRYIQDDLSIINTLMENGVLLQCNYGSIIGQYGRKAEIIIKKLLQNDMVSFLGTDAHRQSTIYSRIRECTNEIYKIIKGEQFKEITETNPLKIINNEEIKPKEPRDLKLTFSEKITM